MCARRARRRLRGVRWRRGGAGAAAAVGAVLMLAGCSADPVRDYVDRSVEILDQGLYADTPEWAEAVDRMRPELYAKDSIPETYAGIGELGRVAGGDHTFLIDPAAVAAMARAAAPEATFPVPSVSTTAGISTVTLPSFNGQQQEAIDRYQDAGVAAVRSAAPETTCGWIVDLRTNRGGNAYPMLSSVGPLLRDGHVLGFQYRDGRTSWIDVENGTVVPPAGIDDGTAAAGFSIDQPVAVVTGPLAASAAETVVVAFAGQADTVRVGEPTAGLTTANDVFDLPDGARIALSVAFYVDRGGTAYDGPIAPDITHASSPATVLDAAADWLRARC